MVLSALLLALHLVGQPREDPARQVRMVWLARELADYGLAEGDPEALAAALRIMTRYPSQVLQEGGVEEPEQGADPSAERLPDLPFPNARGLLAAARGMRPEADLARRLDDLEVQVSRAPASGVLSGSRSVRASHRWTYATDFIGGEVAIVEVRGDGRSDLDLVVYDEAGGWVAADPGSDHRCSVTFLPRQDGSFKVVVRNRGDQPSRFRFVLR
ncbi:MAG: hypothetical protein AB1758_32635 [Candidatus Eremiobacterota bacterium]